MSVWDTACYRCDTGFAILRHLGYGELGEILPFVRNFFSVPKSGLPGLVSDQFPVHEFDLRHFYNKTHERPSLVLNWTIKYLITLNYKVHFEMPGIYRFMSYLYNGEIEVKETEILDRPTSLFRALMTTSYNSGYLKPAFIDTCREQFSKKRETMREVVRLMSLAEAVRHLKFLEKVHSNQQEYKKSYINMKGIPPIPRRAHELLSGVNVRCLHGFVIITFERECFWFRKPDIDRMYRTLLAAAKSHMYYLVKATGKSMTPEGRELKALFDEMFSTMRDLDYEQSCSLARMYDTYFYLGLARHAEDFWDRSTVDLTEKLKKLQEETRISLPKYKRIVDNYGLDWIVDLGKCYKVLPAPNFCIYGAVLQQKERHMNQNSYCADEDDFITREKWEAYSMHSLLRLYYDRHGYCPGQVKDEFKTDDVKWIREYPMVKPSEVPYMEISKIEFSGSFVYQSFSSSYYDTLKDKSLCPSNLDKSDLQADYESRGDYEKNYLLYALSKSDLPHVDTLKSKVVSGNRVAKIALKPESKKPITRNFYIADFETRVVNSEFEANVSEYLSKKKGISLGRSTTEVMEAMRSINNPRCATIGNSHLNISFDIKGWSPLMPAELREHAIKRWAYAFGLDDYQHLMGITRKLTLFWEKHNHCESYQVDGVDLEGFNGRLNTELHANVMGFAIRICREKGLLNHGAKLATLIDDGALRIEYDEDLPKDTVVEVIDTIERVYRFVGLQISWDKTFVSKNLMMYLNDVWYRGAKVLSGLKSIYRIRPESDDVIETPTSQISNLWTNSQAAIRSGMKPLSAYIYFLFEAACVITKWTRKCYLGHDSMALMAFTPVSLSGFGLPSILQLTHPTNTDPMISSIGLFRALAKNAPTTATTINRILTQEMKVQSGRIRGLGECLDRDFKTPLIRNHLQKNANNRTVRELCKYPPTHNIITPTQSTHSAVIAKLEAASPSKFLDVIVNKFKRSTTLLRMTSMSVIVKVWIGVKTMMKGVVASFKRVM